MIFLDSGAGYKTWMVAREMTPISFERMVGTYLENSDSGVDPVQSYVQYLALNSNVENLRII